MSAAADICVKVEPAGSAQHVVCRPRDGLSSYRTNKQGHDGRCMADHTPCLHNEHSALTGVHASAGCRDQPGVWANKKCAKKARKGKCAKRKVLKKCAITCGSCS